MELINNNTETIVNWYKREMKKDGVRPIEIPPDFNLKCLVRTEWVKQDVVEEITEMAIGIAPPQKIKIVPLMTRNCCHYNSTKLCQIVNKKEKKIRHLLGYNFCSCPCGRYYSMELHSVVQDITTGEMMDFTEDFGGETEKWFVPVREIDRDNNGNNYLSVIGFAKQLKSEFLYSRDEKHSCRLPNGEKIYWKPPQDAVFTGVEGRKMFVDAVEFWRNGKIF